MMTINSTITAPTAPPTATQTAAIGKVGDNVVAVVGPLHSGSVFEDNST